MHLCACCPLSLLTTVVWDVGLQEVATGHEGCLGLAVVLNELGLGDGGEHGAGALVDTRVREQLRRGVPVRVPHLEAQLRVEACVAAHVKQRRFRAVGEC